MKQGVKTNDRIYGLRKELMDEIGYLREEMEVRFAESATKDDVAKLRGEVQEALTLLKDLHSRA